jgi:general secretion pathway protein D
LVGNKLDALLSGTTATSTTVNDAVATFTGLLTNPQFQVILRALSQRENTDLLCAPKVTTISGQQAKIEVIREFIYPTEFEPPRVASAASSAATSGAAVSAPMISPPTPGGFQTRNLGVTLNVTPQIGETGLSNLTLIPEVSDFDGFVDYGSRDSLGSSGLNNPSAAQQYTLVFPYPQPVFSVRRVTTSVMVYDGSTVVLGGLIREDATKIQDKVPFLGDIPLFGKLFRNELENTIKKNLMVFVTAKLIDPYGDLINRPTAGPAMTTTDTAPPAAAAPPAAPRP